MTARTPLPTPAQISAMSRLQLFDNLFWAVRELKELREENDRLKNGDRLPVEGKVQ